MTSFEARIFPFSCGVLSIGKEELSLGVVALLCLVSLTEHTCKCVLPVLLTQGRCLLAITVCSMECLVCFSSTVQTNAATVLLKYTDHHTWYCMFGTLSMVNSCLCGTSVLW